MAYRTKAVRTMRLVGRREQKRILDAQGEDTTIASREESLDSFSKMTGSVALRDVKSREWSSIRWGV